MSVRWFPPEPLQVRATDTTRKLHNTEGGGGEGEGEEEDKQKGSFEGITHT